MCPSINHAAPLTPSGRYSVECSTCQKGRTPRVTAGTWLGCTHAPEHVLQTETGRDGLQPPKYTREPLCLRVRMHSVDPLPLCSPNARDRKACAQAIPVVAAVRHYDTCRQRKLARAAATSCRPMLMPPTLALPPSPSPDPDLDPASSRIDTLRATAMSSSAVPKSTLCVGGQEYRRKRMAIRCRFTGNKLACAIAAVRDSMAGGQMPTGSNTSGW